MNFNQEEYIDEEILDGLYKVINDELAYIICSTLKMQCLTIKDYHYKWDGFDDYCKQLEERKRLKKLKRMKNE